MEMTTDGAAATPAKRSKKTCGAVLELVRDGRRTGTTACVLAPGHEETLHHARWSEGRGDEREVDFQERYVYDVRARGFTVKAGAPATGGSAAAPAEQPAIDLRILPLDRLVESPFNKRRTWGDLKELAASMGGGKGILEPLLARPIGAKFELVFGHRRLRAARIAKLPTAPVMVRELGDEEALERLGIENLQRVDVHPLEEAEGYEQLRATLHWTADQIASKVGKSKAYIYGRLKLLELTPEARQAFADEKILPSVAVMVARVPQKLQGELLEELCGDDRWDDGALIGADGARNIIERRFMLRLAEAPFDLGDATLSPSGGSCKACPKRTGNQKELFADASSKDLCTDPDCFKEKKDAQAGRVLEKARATGVTVLEGKDAERAFEWASPYVDLDDKTERPYDPKADEDDTGQDVDGPTYRQLAAEAAKPMRVVVARDARGQVRELGFKEDLLPIVKKGGFDTRELQPPARGSHSSGNPDKARREAAAGKRAATYAVVGAMVAAAEKKVPGSNVWPFLAKLLIDLVGHDAGLETLKRRGVDTKRASGTYSDAVEGKLRKLLAGMTDHQARGLAMELAASRGTFSFGEWAGKDLSPALKAAATFYGVDAGKIGKAARAERVAEKRAKKAAKKGGKKS
jgi:ParB/RepB/Spo0J family partition protein